MRNDYTPDELADVLRRNGFVECDIAACNCGSWHARYGWPERFHEIDDATSDEARNGETLLARVQRIAAENAALKAREEHLERLADEGNATFTTWKANYDDLRARLAEAERDAARIEWLASNPRGGQIVVDGKTQDCVFWGISGHPRATLRDAIDAARATDSAPRHQTPENTADSASVVQETKDA